MEALDGRAGAIVIRHLDESEAFAPAGVAILDHLGAADLAERREQTFEIRIRDLIAQVSHIQFLAHHFTSVKTGGRSKECFQDRSERDQNVVVRQVRERAKRRISERPRGKFSLANCSYCTPLIREDNRKLC